MNFSNIEINREMQLKDNSFDGLVQLFSQLHEKYTGSIIAHEFDQRIFGADYSHSDLVSSLCNSITQRSELECLELVSNLCKNNVPFMIVSHEISFLRDALIRLAVRKQESETIYAVVTYFDRLEKVLADVYLANFLEILGRRNEVRLRHISTLTEKNLLMHFEKHLQWMDRLIAAIQAKDVNLMPAIDHFKCDFGVWLHSDGKNLVRDKSHYLHLLETHKNMHEVVHELNDVLESDSNSLHVYALLKKAENYSLDLGNEIALLNSMVIMSIYNKDPLTGTLTRRSLERVLLSQLEISALTGNAFCLAICDIDRFKKINDTYGHVAGDKCIKYFADFLGGDLRQSDMLFRIGGDEFLIVFSSTGYEQGARVLNKICTDIRSHKVDINAKHISLSASFGLLEVRGDASPIIDTDLVRALIQACDQRLYLAKQRGRGQVA